MKDCFETPLEEWPNATIFSIEPNAVTDIEPMDGFTEICFPAFQLQVVVVTHQGITVYAYSEAFR